MDDSEDIIKFSLKKTKLCLIHLKIYLMKDKQRLLGEGVKGFKGGMTEKNT